MAKASEDLSYSCALQGRHAAVLALLLCACPALARESGSAPLLPVVGLGADLGAGNAAIVPTGLTKVLLPPLDAIDPPVLYLKQRDPQPFLEERRKLMAAIEAAPEGSSDRARALTDLAEFLFAHAMAPEGLSVLGGLDGKRLPPAHKLRASAFELALGLIDPRRHPLTDRARALLSPKHKDWPDQPLFLVLSHLRETDCTEAAPLLGEAVARLARFPKPVQERVLPGFLECAIETEQWRLARDLAAAFDGYEGLRGGTAYHYLLGRAAEAGNEPLAAFDSYAMAQDGRDLWAHRARRAIVDLALRHEAADPTEAVTLLRQETEVWRGDRHARLTLDALASLQIIAGDEIAAIETYGKLMQRHPEGDAAKEARQKARALFGEFYRKGAAGEIALGPFLSAHDRIASYFRFTPAFANAAETLADTFLLTGATTVAAREYATTSDYLAAMQDLGLGAPAPNQLDRLAVKEAEALLRGGQFETLGSLLAARPEPTDPELRARRAIVAARYLDETGQTAELLAEPAPDAPPQALRLRAQAWFDRQDWARANSAYAALHARLGPAMPLPDAIRTLLSAYRAQDHERTAEIAAAFPALTELPGWVEIARTLTEEAPELLPLSKGTAQARIENATETLRNLPVNPPGE
ncbi:hypothetical protein [Sagittula salina]|uniref:Tetratricopeptide repeat-containing protein n=1 Tax=Sagittula salina TaxID=2820268 RepID=A0A940S543_9RHOB|nr:hypothetical protein [Sagittula salina]MBP0484580.1 hypothetical protein [Sagittula salina]